MNVLVTGANGFVGKALCKRLVEDGIKVRSAVRRIVDETTIGEVVNLGDIDGQTEWSNSLQGVGAVVHLAARVHCNHRSTDDVAAEYIRVNVGGTKQLATCAVKAGVKRLVYVSSIKVNGENTNSSPFTENDAPRPMDAYAISKWEAERALQKIAAATDLEVVILRPPLIYGPSVRANFLTLLNLVERGVPLPFGSVRNQRSLLYVGNMVDAIVSCLHHPEASGNTFLISDGEDVSTPELIRHLASLLGHPARLIPIPHGVLTLAGKLLGRSSEASRLVASLQVDSAHIRNVLGWSPPFSMKEGLADTVRWYRAYYA